MAIALDTAGGTTTRVSSVSTSTKTVNNVAGTCLVVAISTNQTSDSVSSITYNGVAMTKVINRSTTAESTSLYILLSPATGSNNLVFTFTTTLTFDWGWASYTGVAGSDVSTSALSGGAASVTETLTTLTDNSWMVAAAGLQRTATAGTNSTYRSGNTASGMSLFDNNAAITPTQSYSMTQNLSGSGSVFVGVAMTLYPSASTGYAHSQTIII